MAPLHLVATQAITEDEARARLRALGPKAIKTARLAREWGWSRWKARKFIAVCRAEGVIPPNAGKAKPKSKVEVSSGLPPPPRSTARSPAAPRLSVPSCAVSSASSTSATCSLLRASTGSHGRRATS
jgi:hypothetical protein